VAEGFNRHSRSVYRNHVAIALGSDGELETQLEIAKQLEVLERSVVDDLIGRTDDLGRLLQGLWRSLRRNKKGAPG
jgi:four helix bundle protein